MEDEAVLPYNKMNGPPNLITYNSVPADMIMKCWTGRSVDQENIISCVYWKMSEIVIGGEEALYSNFDKTQDS